ncbi:MAG: peptidylprolyl isomerase [Clostridia bacterium]|nr:peptidylprolyl isomerase [Clostridia bacterium]
MQNPVATITMKDGGVMKLELYPDVAPNTVKNFISLANAGFYDGLTFHRIIAGFMIQGGDPNGTGSGGPGYSIKGEFTSNGFKNDLKHKRGVISMARTMIPDSAGSQFFIMHADYPYLDGEYAAFGMLLEGFDVLDAIATVQTNRNDAPLTPVVIDTIRVDTFGVDYGEPEKIK